MDPIFFGFISGLGRLIGGLQGARAGKIEAKIAETNAYLAGINREMAKMDAKLAYTNASYKIARVQRAVRAATSSATAHFASANLDPAYGSPLLIQGHAAAQGEADQAILAAQGGLDASTALAHAATAANQMVTSLYAKAAAEDRARQSLLSGFLGFGSSLLRGAGRWPGLSGEGFGGGDYWAPASFEWRAY
ncbi:MAG TPA: hypothetical protein VNK91_06530 [Burkholderiaceae bacterium]|nr:hypothetical protein [Burkholderiaceae bacterium]